MNQEDKRIVRGIPQEYLVNTDKVHNALLKIIKNGQSTVDNNIHLLNTFLRQHSDHRRGIFGSEMAIHNPQDGSQMLPENLRTLNESFQPNSVTVGISRAHGDTCMSVLFANENGPDYKVLIYSNKFLGQPKTRVEFEPAYLPETENSDLNNLITMFPRNSSYSNVFVDRLKHFDFAQQVVGWVSSHIEINQKK
jgi:hypothetical protein